VLLGALVRRLSTITTARRAEPGLLHGSCMHHTCALLQVTVRIRAAAHAQGQQWPALLCSMHDANPPAALHGLPGYPFAPPTQ
jgi:hypothetical protein